MKKKELDRLADRFVRGEASAEEEAQLHAWYDQKASEGEDIRISGTENREQVRRRLYRTLRRRMDKEERTVRPMRTAWFYRMAAAAMLLLSFVGWLYWAPDESPEQIHFTQILPNDVGPGSNIAVLETASGGTINLDEASIGDTIHTGGISVCKTGDGIVSLQIHPQANETSTMHLIRTPRGGQYQIVLPDGTRVWLNSSSSLQFPSRFPPGIREVRLNGEAYFEVARAVGPDQQSTPFWVHSQSQKIEVLGTRFNVSNYQPDKAVTTLISGSVKVISPSSGDTEALLSPGQEYRIANNKAHIARADAESALAWKEGDFIFNDETLDSIIEQLERWYDIEVDCPPDYRGYRFSGAVSRSKNLSSVLKILELTGKIKFELKERRVTIR